MRKSRLNALITIIYVRIFGCCDIMKTWVLEAECLIVEQWLLKIATKCIKKQSLILEFEL
jgi:hypothetical protein